jgi:hypothetical protein
MGSRSSVAASIDVSTYQRLAVVRYSAQGALAPPPKQKGQPEGDPFALIVAVSPSANY